MAKTSVDRKYIRDSIENLQTNEITISEDKLRIKLEKQITRVKKGSGVWGYFSTTITCVGLLVGTDFKVAYGITPDMWKTFFFLAAVACGGLTVFHGFYALCKRVTVETIVTDIKTSDSIEYKSVLWRWIKNKFGDKEIEAEEEKNK